MSPVYQNTETGETHLVAFAHKARHKGPFALIFLAELLDLLQTRGSKLTPLEWRVFLHLVAISKYENIVDEYIGELADALGNDRSSVSKALRELERVNLIAREPKTNSRPQRIHIDPHITFRGVPAQRARALSRSWPPTEYPERD